MCKARCNLFESVCSIRCRRHLIGYKHLCFQIRRRCGTLSYLCSECGAAEDATGVVAKHAPWFVFVFCGDHIRVRRGAFRHRKRARGNRNSGISWCTWCDRWSLYMKIYIETVRWWAWCCPSYAVDAVVVPFKCRWLCVCVCGSNILSRYRHQIGALVSYMFGGRKCCLIIKWN